MLQINFLLILFHLLFLLVIQWLQAVLVAQVGLEDLELFRQKDL